MQAPEDAALKPQIIFEPTVFARETILEKWPYLQKVIISGDQLARAFENIKQSPVWRSDPRLRNITRETADEVLELYNEVIEDERYIADFLAKPADVARKLGLRPSKKAIDVIAALSKSPHTDSPVLAAAVVISVAVVGIAVTTAIVSAQADRRDRILIDESGRVKLGARVTRVKSMRRAKTKEIE